MKNLFFIILVPLFLEMQGCTKSVEKLPENYTTTTQELGSSYFEKDLDSTILTIQLTPVITCYSYNKYTTPKPCEILVKFTCQLTQPLHSYLRIQIKRTLQPSGSLLVDPDQLNNDDLFIILSPFTQYTSLSSHYVNGSTAIVSDIYRIGTIEFLPFAR